MLNQINYSNPNLMFVSPELPPNLSLWHKYSDVVENNVYVEFLMPQNSSQKGGGFRLICVTQLLTGSHRWMSHSCMFITSNHWQVTMNICAPERHILLLSFLKFPNLRPKHGGQLVHEVDLYAKIYSTSHFKHDALIQSISIASWTLYWTVCAHSICEILYIKCCFSSQNM